MLHSALILIGAAHVALCGPQFVSMKDGKIGVNFGGYHAEAGLGGLLTGNAAHGGLTASAGTPFGQNAAAGLGGVVDGRPAGTAFAGATAGGNVGASAGLGGVVGSETDSGLRAEAHAGGSSHSVVGQGGGGFQIRKTISLPPPPSVEFQGDFYSANNAAASANVDIAGESDVVVQKIKPQKKVVHEAAPTNVVPVVQKRKQVVVQSAPAPAPAAGYGGFAAQGRVDGGFFDSIFNIPIQTLKAVNGFLNTKAQAGGGIQFQKSAGFQLG